jgi:hypothetical protein
LTKNGLFSEDEEEGNWNTGGKRTFQREIARVKALR